MLSRQALLRSTRAAAPSRAFASQIRSYAAANETVKPPVALFGLDGTYATALVRHRADSFRSQKRSLDLYRISSSGQLACARNRSRRKIEANMGELGGLTFCVILMLLTVHGRRQDLFPRADRRCAEQAGWTFGQGHQAGVNPRGADAERRRQEPGCC